MTNPTPWNDEAWRQRHGFLSIDPNPCPQKRKIRRTMGKILREQTPAQVRRDAKLSRQIDAALGLP